MKLPTLWIACAFATGIVLAGVVPVRLWYCVALAVVGITVGFVLLRGKRIAAAWIVGLVAWAGLGGVAARMEQSSVPATQVTRLAADGKLDLSEPLRWRGRLRRDSMRLPWGTRFEIDLESVESAGQELKATGGLRVNSYLDERHPEPPINLRAGDRVEVLVKAREPRNYLDPGAADTRGMLARQNIHLVGSLRSTELLKKLDTPSLRLADRLARVRGRLLEQVNSLFPDSRDRTAVLRAMLLGDRNFVDTQTAEVFQKTAAFHVLVLAGLHVAALAIFVFWLARRMRLNLIWTTAATLVVLAAYLGVVQDRPPILRAALMAAIFLGARLLFRRMEMLNGVAMAALVLLIARPPALGDASFQLSFLAAGVIAGLAMPWIERTSGPYREGLAHLGDATRDVSFPVRVVQFRLDLRMLSAWIEKWLPARLAGLGDRIVTLPMAAGFRLWEVIVLSTTIQLGLLPLLAEYFHRVSIYGPASNVPAVLLTGLIVPLGFVTLGTSLVWGAAARVIAKLLGGLVSGLLASVGWISHWPLASHRIPGSPVWLMVLFFGALVMLAIYSRAALGENRVGNPRRRRLWGESVAGVALVVCALAVSIFPFAPRLKAGQLEVTVLDVGQGDSIFTAFPDGRTMLVDGGGQFSQASAGGNRTGQDIGEEVVSPYLWQRGLKQVDVIALTHAHHDHLDGLYAVMDNFKVKELWVGRDVDSPAYTALLAYARARGVTVVHHLRGDSFVWGGTNGHVLWPENPVIAPKANNDDCLVLRIEDGGVRFLLTGDIEKRVEGSLVKDGDPLGADFLKVPHHGSKTSSTEKFLSLVGPRVAVVSVGEGNPFGHPNPETVGRLEGTKARVLRTDRDGAVMATTDGRELVVRTFVEMRAR